MNDTVAAWQNEQDQKKTKKVPMRQKMGIYFAQKISAIKKQPVHKRSWFTNS